MSCKRYAHGPFTRSTDYLNKGWDPSQTANNDRTIELSVQGLGFRAGADVRMPYDKIPKHSAPQNAANMLLC